MMLLLIIGSFIYMGMYIYAYVYKYMRCVQKITRITENLVGLESTIVKHFFFYYVDIHTCPWSLSVAVGKSRRVFMRLVILVC